MSDSEVRADGLDKLIADIAKAGAEALPRARQAVQVTSHRVRDDARRFASGLRHAPLYPYSITYDTRVGAGWVEGEIGPDKGRPQGPLGNLLEYGSVNNAPHAHLGPALDRNSPDFVRGIDLATRDLL